jgi:hypothetical protein
MSSSRRTRPRPGGRAYARERLVLNAVTRIDARTMTLERELVTLRKAVGQLVMRVGEAVDKLDGMPELQAVLDADIKRALAETGGVPMTAAEVDRAAAVDHGLFSAPLVIPFEVCETHGVPDCPSCGDPAGLADWNVTQIPR